MTAKHFLVIEKQLLLRFPSLTLKGPLMFVQPLGDILRGFHWESSGRNKNDFYVNVFFLPLYVPTRQLHFTFGHRLGMTKRWNIESSDLIDNLSLEMQREISFLVNLKTAKEAAKALEPFTKPNAMSYVNPHCDEALAYSLVQAGDSVAAANILDRLLHSVDSSAAWEAEIALRARLIQNKLSIDIEDAQEQLLSWQNQTIHELGMEVYSSAK